MTNMPERIRMTPRESRVDDFQPATMKDNEIFIGSRKYIAADLAKENADAAYRAGFEAAKDIIAAGRMASEIILDACEGIRAITPPKREGETK